MIKRIVTFTGILLLAVGVGTSLLMTGYARANVSDRTAMRNYLPVIAKSMAAEPPPQPTASATPMGTPSATPVGTPPPPSSGHDVTQWHPPGDDAISAHHHGHDPMDTIFADYIAANWDQTIAYSWVTSAAENAWPEGKHDGFKYLYEEDTGCDQFNPGGEMEPGNCVKAYLLQVHSLGTANAMRTRTHSDRGLFLVCKQGGAGPCDIVEMGGHADYGVFHSRYKNTICTTDPANPAVPDSLVFNQPPYRTVNGSARQIFFWSSLINTIVHPYYDPVPAQHFQVAWGELNVWSSPTLSPSGCSDPTQDSITGENGTQYQLFTIMLNLEEHTARPFNGFTDVHGNLNPSCQAEGPDCVPFYIGANVPQGDAYINRPVMHGDSSAAPIQDFDDGTELLMNTYHPAAPVHDD